MLVHVSDDVIEEGKNNEFRTRSVAWKTPGLEQRLSREENLDVVLILETRAPYNIRGGDRRHGPNGQRPGPSGPSRPSPFWPFRNFIILPSTVPFVRVPFFTGKGPSRALAVSRNPSKMALTGPLVEKCSIFGYLTVTACCSAHVFVLSL